MVPFSEVPGVATFMETANVMVVSRVWVAHVASPTQYELLICSNSRNNP